MKQKYLAVALSAIFSTVALTGCGSDNDSNYIPPSTPDTGNTDNTPGTGNTDNTPDTDTPDTDTPEVPDIDGTEDNAGDAAINAELEKESTVGGQQYVRSDDAKFDRIRNSTDTPETAENNANATVLNSVHIQNERLNNIVLGRETVNRKEGSESVLRYAGKSIDGGFSDKPSSDTLDLQDYNGARLTRVVTTTTETPNTAINNDGYAVYDENNKPVFDADGNALYYTQTTTENNSNAIFDVNGDSVKDNEGNSLYFTTTSTPTDVVNTGTEGLYAVYEDGEQVVDENEEALYYTDFTETDNGNPILDVNGDHVVDLTTSQPLYFTYATTATPNIASIEDGYPVFDAGKAAVDENGHALYYTKTTTEDNGNPILDVNGAPVLDGDENPLYFTTTTGTTSKNVVIPGSNIDVKSGLNAENGLVNIRATNTTDTGLEEDSTTGTRIFGKNYLDTRNQAEVNSLQFTGETNEDGTLDIGETPIDRIKLNHVQYGRVTSNIDRLDQDTIDAGKNAKYYESNIVAKGTDNSVDTYFYRGTGETSIEQMNALQEAGGTFQYKGHALMYGINNDYHGDVGDPNSNSFGGTDIPVEGTGNFVKATVDMGDRTIAGNVFNVWEVTPNESDTNVFHQDNVVDFSGDIRGNTAKGNANLSYDKDNKGAFKGSFFGDNAEELGGSLNSVSDNLYGKADWGGVFGAKKLVTTEVPPVEVTPTTPENGNANQTEDRPNR